MNWLIVKNPAQVVEAIYFAEAKRLRVHFRIQNNGLQGELDALLNSRLTGKLSAKEYEAEKAKLSGEAAHSYAEFDGVELHEWLAFPKSANADGYVFHSVQALHPYRKIKDHDAFTSTDAGRNC